MIEKSQNIAEVSISYQTKVKASDRAKITTSQDSHATIYPLFDQSTIEHHETFLILMLNRANKVLGWAKISQGGTSGTVVDPKVVFQIALAANASSIILAHNHPSGNKQPSECDIQLTKRLREAGKILELSVLDHIIVTPEQAIYTSMADEGLL